MEVSLFVSCVVDQFYQSIGWDSVAVLEHFGSKVHYNPNQTCCGLPAYNNGHREMAKEVAVKFLEDFNNDLPIVCPTPMCANMVKKSYDHFFKNTSFHNVYRRLQSRVFTLSEFLLDELKVDRIASSYKGKAVFFNNCQAFSYLGVERQPVQLLEMVSGLQLLKVALPTSCCGASGDFAAHNEIEAVEMAEKHLQPIIESGADTVISNDIHCLMHMQSIAKKAAYKIDFKHLSGILAEGLKSKV